MRLNPDLTVDIQPIKNLSQHCLHWQQVYAKHRICGHATVARVLFWEIEKLLHVSLKNSKNISKKLKNIHCSKICYSGNPEY